jgi:hypothetical protein
MSKTNATTIFRHRGKSLTPWDVAIRDAESMIVESKKRIATLRAAIQGFQTLRDAGHPWPGEKSMAASDADGHQIGLSGQPNHL